ncbi:SAVED domain-containing protein [Desulfuromonas acetoxidans]|uniref:SAVED domain-containing protein n=1 Tax=Desulfuromonas acetoxidans TaxID=891 RepID=UPI00292D4DE9|nr:SAVED domain-containing protein [Desulfuromonas acetoxidans]
MANKKIKEVTRYIKKDVERELWARAAGRCQFNGCNRILYKSPVTQERVNISEKAHIYSFSEDGPRGWGPFKKNPQGLNDVGNLMLMCHDCHKTIDQDKDGTKYSGSLLQQWKKEHEHRVVTVTGIASNRKSHVVFYGSNIGEQRSPLQQEDAMEAMFPERYPVSENSVCLSMSCSHEDKTAAFWESESAHLNRAFDQKILPLIENDQTKHFSLFSLAPIPLLIQLGALFTDKISVETYQPIKEPKGWHWQEFPDGFEFLIKKPKDVNGTPVLVLSLSDIINHERIRAVMGEQVSVWELTVPEEFIGNDNIRNRAQLSLMRSVIRKLMVLIKDVHGVTTPLSVFPAMAVSCSIEMGRARMPKADMPWVIYDQNNKEKKFIKAITIGDSQ